MKSNIPTDPLSQFSLGIFKLNGLLMQSGEGVTRPLGQTSAKWQILGRAGFQPQTVSQMAREMGNSRQNVQYTADVLARAGLVVFLDNPADKRAKVIGLTPKGEKVLEAIYDKNQQMSQEIMLELDAKQIKNIANALDDIANTLEDLLSKKQEQTK